MGRVVVERDIRIEKGFPQEWRVTLHLVGGRQFEQHVRHPKGDPGESLELGRAHRKIPVPGWFRTGHPHFARLASAHRGIKMSRLLLFFCTALLAFAADNPWAKVKDLKTGTDIRIYKVGAKQPILAKMDELTDESLVVILKNEQTAISKDEIDRIDYRPPQTSRSSRESKTTTELPQPVGPRPTPGTSVPGSSSSTTVSSAAKPDFETIYRRTTEPPPQK
jgi:hypothetical protein